MLMGKQIFAGSLGRYFVGKLYDVTKEDTSYMCTSINYKQTAAVA